MSNYIRMTGSQRLTWREAENLLRLARIGLRHVSATASEECAVGKLSASLRRY